MTEEEFEKRALDGSLHLSFSSIKHLLKSPLHYRKYRTKTWGKSTPSMQFGTWVHECILEPEEFLLRNFPLPDIKRNTKAGKETYNELIEANPNKKPIPYKDFELILKMKEAFMNVPKCRWFWENADAFEKKIEIVYKGVKIKMVLDLVGDGYIVDLKTTPDASKGKFYWQIKQMLLYLQAAIYSLTQPDNHVDCYMIALDRDCGVSMHHISQPAIEKGLEILDRAVAKFLECKIKDPLFLRNIDAYSNSADGSFPFEFNY